MRSSTRLPREPAEMACSVASAAVATASKRLSGSSSSSYAMVPSSLARPRIWSLGASEAASEASSSAAASEASAAAAASPIFWNLPAATRTEPRRAEGQDTGRADRGEAVREVARATREARAAIDDAAVIEVDISPFLPRL